MTAEQQRIAIAEACGTINQGKWYEFEFKPYSKDDTWKSYPSGNKAAIERTRLEFIDQGTECKEVTERFIPDRLPDYLNDLNAMSEAAKKLDIVSKRVFAETLQRVCDLSLPGDVLGDLFAIQNATAAQRAEAFLRTLNLWAE